MNYVYEYCIGNDNVSQSEIQEILEDIMDQEFDTICEDNSAIGRLMSPDLYDRFVRFLIVNFFPPEISSMLTKYLQMIHDKQYDDVRNEVSAMPPCNTQWLNPNFKLEFTVDSDSSCSDDEDEEMDVCHTDVQSTSRTNAPITDEDGWTTVASKRR